MKRSFLSFCFVLVAAFGVRAAGHTVTTTQVNVTCNGMCNGSSTASVSGGVGPFTYSWSSGGTSATETGLCAGNDTVYCTDNSDMSIAIAIVTITQPPLLTIGLGGSSICGGGCTTLSPLVSGGTPAYTYAWSLGLFGPTPSACPATTTTYTVTVTDANGCVAMATPTVTVMPTPTATIPSYTICAGTCITISPSVTGGTPTYNYNWSPAGTGTIVNPTVCPTSATTYTLNVTDINGCVSGPVTTTVMVSPPITSGITSTNATGCVTCDGTATVSPTGGSSPYVYNWSTGATTATISSLCPGTYSVTITDISGCTATDSTTVFAANDLIANFTMVPDSTNAYNFFAFNSSTGAGNSYAWDFADGVVSSLASPSHTYALPGTYTICLIASNFLCGADTLCQPVTVTGVLASCNALFNIADDTINPDPNAHYVYNLSYGAALTYLWDFGDGTTSTSATPSHVYSGTGPYLLCLSIDNGAGCTDMYCDSLISADSLNRSSGIMQFTVYDVPTFYSASAGVDALENINSVFVSPNPFNDITTFEIKSNGTETYSFELIDVLGKKVKSMNEISEKQFSISREGLENGIYFYKIYSSESIVGIGKIIIK